MRGAGEFAGVADGGALGGCEAFLLRILERAHLVFTEPGFGSAGEVGGDTERALVGVGSGQVHDHLGAAIDRTRTHQRAIERHEVLERFGAVGHGAKERIRLFGFAFEAGEEFVVRGIDPINRGCHRH